jgi:hypothetical protein
MAAQFPRPCKMRRDDVKHPAHRRAAPRWVTPPRGAATRATAERGCMAGQAFP